MEGKENMEKNKMEHSGIELTSLSLHILAMVLMLLDHLWLVLPGNVAWMTCLGRLAFPIFAFLTVEGFFHTKNLKRYMGRMLLFALLSELPFNLMMTGGLVYPFHQNVLWSFLIGLWLMWINEKAKATKKPWISVVAGAGTVVLGIVLGTFSMVDYGYVGVLTVLMFYFLRGEEWWHHAGQLLVLVYLNKQLGGVSYEITLFGAKFFFQQQSLAVLALIPIWLYQGKQGLHNKTLQFSYYAFYPVHMLIIGLLVRFL